MIERDREIETVQKLLQRHPVVGIVGARQVGKTRTQGDLEGHPKVGASREGFVLGQIIRLLGVRSDECFFWATPAS
jgi:hypothetical protein